MSRPNVHGLPQFLRKDDKGYFLDYFISEGGLKKRKRVRLGQIPLAQAKQVLAQHTREIVAGRFLAEEKQEVTFTEAADSFLGYSEARRRSHDNDIQMVKRLKDYFGNRPLRSLTPDVVEGFLTHRRKVGNQAPGERRTGMPLSNSTLNRDLGILKCIVNRAVFNGLLEKNPIQRVRPFKEESRDRTLTSEEYQSLLGYCSPRLSAIVQLAYWTGMRKGEILGLRWEQVDFQNKVINLEAADTKTQEKREVPLTEALIGLLKRTPKTLGCPYVFTERGKHILDIKTAFLKAVRTAGIENFRFHDLRHCAVTNLRKAGVNDSVIMSISGHKTYAMFKRYNRIDRQDRVNALKQVERQFDTDMTRAEAGQVAK
ncbi:MAG TPA: tyrosine-type recombinase/integrase [bacterium]|nr:tyrosine-type recombinase/integrase [bacterium]